MNIKDLIEKWEQKIKEGRELLLAVLNKKLPKESVQITWAEIRLAEDFVQDLKLLTTN